MTKYKIAVLPGDGIGKDVMDAAMMVLNEIGFEADYIHGDVGWEFWRHEGNPLPDRTLKLLRETDACLFGAITSKPKEEAARELDPELRGKGFVYFSPIVRARQELNLYTNLRPCRAYPGNPLNYRDDIDLVIFRENTEDLYSGVEFFPVPARLDDMLNELHPKYARFHDLPADHKAISLRINTIGASERIIRAAFEFAKANIRKSVTIVEKPNVVRETSGLMVRAARRIAADYPGIELWEANIDAMAMWLVKNPQDYDVLVASNLFGDIISDLAAQLIGGLGFSPSGNIGKDAALFEPTHGSAPKYAGLDKVNPIAMILAAKMMLEHLGETKLASKIEYGVKETIKEGEIRTYDMGGTSSTSDVACRVARWAREG